MRWKAGSERASPRWLRAASLLVMLGLMGASGCSTTRVIDNEVRAFANASAPAALGPVARYRFERLPSQQAEPGQDRLEHMAQAALSAVGLLVQLDEGPALRVQVELRAQALQRSPWDDPWFWGGGFGGPWGLPGRDYAVTGRGAVVPLWSPRFPSPPWYQRELVLVIRDPQGPRVLYETRARHDGPWRDDQRIVPAMLQAALSGFPVGSGEPRQVDVSVPR